MAAFRSAFGQYGKWIFRIEGIWRLPTSPQVGVEYEVVRLEIAVDSQASSERNGLLGEVLTTRKA